MGGDACHASWLTLVTGFANRLGHGPYMFFNLYSFWPWLADPDRSAFYIRHARHLHSGAGCPCV